VGAAGREDCHTDEHGLGISHLTNDLPPTRWSSERPARIEGRHFGPRPHIERRSFF
jgi:hypothetical protein